ncbi:MAG: phosphoribosylglycinamide formyltransferase [Candidatus Aureabacteria bacterium]|nr:phosphoribosylglycinamide formyltransferase [Candidatus Auribacterota bacterium]
MALKVAVLGSGSGTNFESIAEYFSQEDKKNIAEIVCVISDIPNAYIIERARKRNIPAVLIPCTAYKTKLDSEAEIKYVDYLKDYDTELVVLAGFMRIVKDDLLLAFPGRVINIHPALLPSFRGLKSWQQAYDYGVKVTGCTVHIVDSGIDTGPIIAQRVVEILSDDTNKTIHENIQVEEHDVYPKVIEAIALGRVTLEKRRVILKGGNI